MVNSNANDSVLNNPGNLGSFSFNEIIYASSGLDYSVNSNLGEYQVYQSPSTNFETQRLNLDGIADLGTTFISGQVSPVGWPFTISDVPINGHVRVPEGNGPFPLVLFAHGNHSPLENSTPGYIYLCEHLASYGIIAATIDVNFLNGINGGENDARAIVHLEHTKQFLAWNAQIGHPLEGKVDSSKIIIVGHSRGGEAVGHASLFNSLTVVQFDPLSAPIPLDGSQGLGPYGFNINAVVAIAPTDGQYIPVSGPTKVVDNFFLIHGSRDNDVWPFPGYKTYDRSHGVDLANPSQLANGFKSLLWIHGGNHNFFNSIWQQESVNTISRTQQEQIARVYLSALSLAIFTDQPAYLELLKNHGFGVDLGWLPDDINYVSQFQDPNRLFIQHFEESGNDIVISNPVEGSVETTSVNANKIPLQGSALAQFFQDTQGLRFEWNNNAARYSVDLETDTLNLDDYSFISFRIGQSSERNNPSEEEQDFKVEIRDNLNNIVTFSASSINQLLYPDFLGDPNNLNGRMIRRIVMQSFRISFADLESRGIDISKIKNISLLFDIVNTGTLYFDDLQLTN